MNTELSIVGKSVIRVDALEKATGKAVYIDDISLPVMLVGKILRSPLPHARIVRIDTSLAERLPGVKAVITAADLPDRRYGAYVEDTPVLAREKVRYIGEPVAAVAAVNAKTAAEALSLIKVEYEELEAVLDPKVAMDADAPLVHENVQEYHAIFNAVQQGNICSHTSFKEGDVEAGFAKSDFVFEHTFSTPMQHQCHLEPNGAIASVDGSGKVTVWTSTQAAHLNQIRISQSLLIPNNKIRVIAAKVGGGFGAKVEPTVQPVAVALAQKSGRPVKIILTRQEEFTTTRPRHGSDVYIKSGVMKDGTLVARQVRLLYDSGAYADDGPGIAGFGGLMSLGPYKIPNYRIDSYCVYTNKIAAGAFRGFGNPQCTFAGESHMDIIAESIGMDAVEFRLKNALENGDLAVGGLVMPSVGIKVCLVKAAQAAGWGKSRSKGRGLGVACLQHVSGVLTSSANIRLNEDGTVTLAVGAVDIGQGSDTVLSQIAAEQLGVPFEDINIVSADTDATPYNWATCASRVTYTNGNAVYRAAEDAKQQILKLASRFLERDTGELELKDGAVRVKGAQENRLTLRDLGGISHWVTYGPILGRGNFCVEGHTYDPDKVKGFPFGTMAAFIFGAHVVEVEVDEDTGKVRVVNAVAAHDAGRAVNPTLVEGQIEGGLTQGIGYALFEEMVIERGKVINDNMLDYKIPTALDVPSIHPIIVEEKDPTGPFGAKGVGEPGLVATAPAIANAIKDVTGIRLMELPMNPERLWKVFKKK